MLKSPMAFQNHGYGEFRGSVEQASLTAQHEDDDGKDREKHNEGEEP